eukprot:TRINITY_DN1355_c0_g1_i7.p1 TRINITY_DN1355_c0_g1~~TRINITY_DN1355_c0_g1_i7.p1  ORF type:complete len:178 (-),score=33.47 TRINITY_DN1355_c0_g1_i7:23-556(-)
MCHAAQVLGPALLMLQKKQLRLPVIVSASISPNPMAGASELQKVDGVQLVQMIRLLYPSATLCLGWAGCGDGLRSRYGERQISDMLEFLSRSGWRGNVGFAIEASGACPLVAAGPERAGEVSENGLEEIDAAAAQLRRLLEVPRSVLLFSGTMTPTQLEGLKSRFPPDRALYDVRLR